MQLLRSAEQDRLRALRSARLARLQAAGRQPDDEAETALREFLRALLPEDAPAPEAPRPAAAAVLPFQRPAAHEAPAATGDLDRLSGVGPGLLEALRAAGLARLADVAALEAETLAARLGPIGRLVPAGAWIAEARRVEEAG
jgi:predicted flap endonuclease-1-like 5' DNA nuclease